MSHTASPSLICLSYYSLGLGNDDGIVTLQPFASNGEVGGAGSRKFPHEGRDTKGEIEGGGKRERGCPPFSPKKMMIEDTLKQQPIGR